MTILQIIGALESVAPLSLQESYDNAGLTVGQPNMTCTGVICSLDATEAVIEEAIQKGCNLVVVHHPVIFSGLKKINGLTNAELTVMKAIKHDIAIYAMHTNADNLLHGVNGYMADRIGLINRTTLLPHPAPLLKLSVFVPEDYVEQVRQALFAAGAGHIGNYSEVSFSSPGIGTFKAGDGARPFVGDLHERHEEAEQKLEVVLPIWRQQQVVAALKKVHPYEEVAYDIYQLKNTLPLVGSGLSGYLPQPMEVGAFLQLLKNAFSLSVIRHTPLVREVVEKVALCGGAGSFLTKNAIAASADIFISSDFKYHEYFDNNGQIIIADIGHWESEQFTVNLIVDILKANFPTFAVQNSEISTNPVHYFT
jgi:dinuclear metal center YbgI/SA1388 family protein